MISIIKADGTSEVRQLEAMRARAAQKNADIELAVSAVMQNIKENGLSAVRDYSRQFDHREPYELTRAQLEEAYRSCPAELIAALEHAAANIRDYNEKLLSRTMEWTSPDGGRVGRIVRGLSRVGIYVPGGTAAYPSSVLMNAVPAKVAGVEEIVMVTPPTENLNAAVLAAARIAGVDRCIAVGGAQAVAALTYGAGFIPRVDKLVGPGNAYVAAAKRLAYGSLDIDMVAGPSEVLVIADRPADPKYVAADLLSQAEHDRLASAVLLTDSWELAQAVAWSPSLSAAVENDYVQPIGQSQTVNGVTATVEYVIVDRKQLSIFYTLDYAPDLGPMWADCRITPGDGSAGTGVLRKAVQEKLNRDKRVESWRIGGAGEGGAGATVVTLKTGKAK